MFLLIFFKTVDPNSRPSDFFKAARNFQGQSFSTPLLNVKTKSSMARCGGRLSFFSPKTDTHKKEANFVIWLSLVMMWAESGAELAGGRREPTETLAGQSFTTSAFMRMSNIQKPVFYWPSAGPCQ